MTVLARVLSTPESTVEGEEGYRSAGVPRYPEERTLRDRDDLAGTMECWGDCREMLPTWYSSSSSLELRDSSDSLSAVRCAHDLIRGRATLLATILRSYGRRESRFLGTEKTRMHDSNPFYVSWERRSERDGLWEIAELPRGFNERNVDENKREVRQNSPYRLEKK